jgi:hypothetical protein
MAKNTHKDVNHLRWLPDFHIRPFAGDSRKKYQKQVLYAARHEGVCPCNFGFVRCSKICGNAISKALLNF